MGVRSSVEIWVGFEGKKVVSEIVRRAGFDQEESSFDWETPSQEAEWACVYDYDGNTLVGFGVSLLSACPQASGEHAEALDINLLKQNEETARKLLVEFLQQRNVPQELLDQMKVWICPDFG